MDFLNNVMSEDLNPFGDDLLPDFLPDMQGFDHLANLPIVNGDMEMENIHGNIEEKTTTDDLLDPLLREFFDETKILSDLSEIDGIKIESLDLDASFSLPEMVDCVEQEKPKPEDEKPIFPPLAEDAFATIKKLWPDQVEIFKPEKKKRIPKIQKKLKQKCVIARKNMSLVSTGKLRVEKEPVIKPVRREDKSIKRRQGSDEESSDEVDIETVDDESNSKSGSQLLSMKLNGSAARVRAIVPKNRPLIKSLPPIVKVKSPVFKDETKLNEPIPQFKLGALKIETQAIKVEPREEINNNGIKVKVEVKPQVMVNFSQDIVDRETSSPIVEPKDNVVTVSGLEDKQKEVEMSPDTLENLKRRENLMRMLPKGARIKQKSKDSVVEKIRQSTQPQRTSILIPMPENPFVKTKSGKFSVKNHEASGPQTPKKNTQVASGPEPLVKLNSPTITSTNSPPDSFKVVKPNAISPRDTISKIYEQSILKPVMAKVGNGTAAKTKNCLSQPSVVSSSTSGGSSSNQNVEILIKPIVSALTTTVQRKLMNGDKIALMDELQKLLPAIFPSANKSDHNYCSNNVVTANDKSKTISTVNTSSVDTYLTATKSESKPVIDSFGVSPVVIKLDDKNKPNVSCENKLKKYLVNKETGKTISSPWQQDILLEELRSMKRKCKNSAGSLPFKKHRSSCSPSTSSSSQSNYCYSRSPSHSPRTSGTFTNRSRGEKFGNNNRNYRRRRSRSFGRNSSSRSRSPVYNRKSFSRSRSRSKSPWNKSKKLRKRSTYSRSPSRSRSRSRSWSRSGDSYGRSNFSRNNSRFPVWSENAYKSTREEKNKQIEEKRVIFVGNVPDGTKKKQLYERFRKFGRIIEISVHFRDDRENYGFVTFSQHSAASDALEHGNENPNLPRFDLRYGCGRQCKKSKYCDFDSQMMSDAPNKTELDFDSLLQSTQAQLYRKRKC